MIAVDSVDVGSVAGLQVGARLAVAYYDVTRDGQRFLIPTLRPSEDVRVVLNWRTLLPR